MSNNTKVAIVDCPRDAIQSLVYQIPTADKAAYINALIKSKLFQCIDFGSFVSEKAVPQMRDTALLIDRLDKDEDTQLLAIIANEKGAEKAIAYEKIDYLGYPFSISEIFQQKNTRQSIAESFDTVKRIFDIIQSRGKQELLIYISMAFGNPYQEQWDVSLVAYWIDQLKQIGVKNFALADTTSQANVQGVEDLFSKMHQEFPTISFTAHLHAMPELALEKIEAAYKGGCRRFDGSILGYGGCQFAQNNLVGNIPSELLINRFKQQESTAVLAELATSFSNMIQNGE
ncbi:MAG: hydroxymethylglutaryl-CoA lyase [Sphingobacterium sp.]